MQATTTELAVVGAALEAAALAVGGGDAADAFDADRFAACLAAATAEPATATIVRLAAAEARVYAAGRPVTYAAGRRMLDILTDTTERSPTFSLPPFLPRGAAGPRPWAFVQDPSRPTAAAWEAMLQRAPRPIDWTAADYAAMGAPARIVDRPPALDRAAIHAFGIGHEPVADRFDGMMITVSGTDESPDFGDAAECLAARFADRDHLRFGSGADAIALPPGAASEPLRLSERLVAKLVLNTLSTATMAVAGRLTGNWMVHVSCTNMKLIDRGARLLADQLGLPYDAACLRLFEAMQALAANPNLAARTSPVAFAIEQAAAPETGTQEPASG